MLTLLSIYLLCVCGGHMHTWGQEITCGNQVSPSTMWTWIVRFGIECLHQLSHLADSCYLWRRVVFASLLANLLVPAITFCSTAFWHLFPCLLVSVGTSLPCPGCSRTSNFKFSFCFHPLSSWGCRLQHSAWLPGHRKWSKRENIFALLWISGEQHPVIPQSSIIE